MFDWLKILGLTIISPIRGLNEAYTRSPLIPSLVLLIITQTFYYLYLYWDVWLARVGGNVLLFILTMLITAFIMSLILVVLFVPILISISNFIERRGSITQVVQQEFSPTASTVSYAYMVINLVSLLVMFLIKQTQWAAKLSTAFYSYLEKLKQQDPQAWQANKDNFEKIKDAPEAFFFMIFYVFIFPVTLFFILWAVRAAFRLSWIKTIVITVLGVISMPLIYALFSNQIGFILGSPILLILGFFLLQGYFREFARKKQAEADFKRSLEIATLNPSDASAHYNLGLIYQQRNDFEEARKSFEKAVGIDDDETDAHYQLGKIARQQNRLQDAINHFSKVVEQSRNHAQYEIWREVGATYLAANQFADAKDALEKFLAERPSDPEGLYLMGRTQIGLGNKPAAITAMRACIEAVKTAPDYKNRKEQHWLKEAEKFLKSNT